jgi:hypothetical protein
VNTVKPPAGIGSCPNWEPTISRGGQEFGDPTVTRGCALEIYYWGVWVFSRMRWSMEAD